MSLIMVSMCLGTFGTKHTLKKPCNNNSLFSPVTPKRKQHKLLHANHIQSWCNHYHCSKCSAEQARRCKQTMQRTQKESCMHISTIKSLRAGDFNQNAAEPKTPPNTRHPCIIRTYRFVRKLIQSERTINRCRNHVLTRTCSCLARAHKCATLCE